MPTALGALGVLFAIVSGWFYSAGVRVETTVASPDAPGGFTGVANLQLMHFQSIDFMVAIGAAVVAAIFICAAAVTSRMPPPPQ